MRRHLTNAAYGLLDYAAYPFGMLLVAPIVLHRLGAFEYGIWTIATAVISIGGIIASGFSDANIQRVARLRGTGDTESMVHTVRSILGINLVLGGILAVAAWMAAPFGAAHIAGTHPAATRECLIALRIASALILVRAVETVSVSTQRAFERFSGTVRISTAVRLVTLGCAALLALSGHRAVSILTATALIFPIGTYLQFRELRKTLGSVPLLPAFRPEETRGLLRFGVFTWVQAVGSVVFGQLDRVLLGVSLGAVAVAPYSLCVQFAHPIFGLTASGLQFLFPYLSERAGTVSPAQLKRTLWKAFACNLVLVSCGSALLLLFGGRLIQAWAGAAVARTAVTILPKIVLGSALMGLSVTGTYALLALGVFRTVAIVNLSARALVLLAMTYLIHHSGLQGLALARMSYGVFAMLLYVPLWRRLRVAKGTQPAAITPLLAKLATGMPGASKS